MTQMTLTEDLERLVRNASEDADVRGIRVFVQYCLTEESGRSEPYFNVVTPTIICHSMKEHGLVSGSYTEKLPFYYLVETGTQSVEEVGARVKSRALEITQYAKEHGLRTVAYMQSPPQFLVLNGVCQKDKTQ